MVGTLAMAFLNEASLMAAKALRPARINSLFLIPTPSVKARFFMSPIWSNSVLGMVKLSRTTLSFLSFRGLAGAAAYTRSVKIAGSGRGGKDREETLEIRSLNNAKTARAKKGKVADLGFKPNRVTRLE